MDRALKQRLVGASVLIALAVIVLPMLFTGDPGSRDQASRKIELPAPPAESAIGTRRFPIGDAPPEPVVEGQAGAEADAAAPVASEPSPSQEEEADPAPATAEQTAPALEPTTAKAEPQLAAPAVQPAPAPVEQPAQPATTVPGRYVVQVASLGSADNARRIAGQLQQQGYAVLQDTVESDVGRLHRVRAGPYDSEAEAVGVAQKIGKQLEGVSPRIVDLQPEQTALVTTPGDPFVRWVVQAGSFAERVNADSLVERLKAAGMNAYLEAVSTTDSTVYKVRVGPFLEREEAIRTKQVLQEKHSVNSVVMTAD